MPRLQWFGTQFMAVPASSSAWPVVLTIQASDNTQVWLSLYRPAINKQCQHLKYSNSIHSTTAGVNRLAPSQSRLLSLVLASHSQ